MRIIIYAALIGLTYSTISQAAAQGSNSDPFAYCRTVKNSGLNPTGGMDAPKVIKAAMKGWPTMWRCMDSDVYACATDADGMGTRLCNTVPAAATTDMKQYCARNPNDTPPMSLNGTGADWSCKGKIPVIDTKSAGALDKNHYRLDVWKKISPAY